MNNEQEQDVTMANMLAYLISNLFSRAAILKIFVHFCLL
jgi:hypothetical protein